MIGRLIQTYRVDALLGEGGMGTVYRATDTMLERPVAMKMLRPALLSQPQFLERFKREAVTLAKLNHPNIATLYNFIREDDDYFMVMEYVEGQTLDQWLQAFGPLPYTLAVPVVMQALDGLQHAHKRSILHRDLKPANLMITPDGMVKIMDFGIARIMGSQRLTQVNRIIGTLEYMAPEQILGKDPTPQADIYALGVVLYELLSGKVPLTGDSEYNTMERIMNNIPTPLADQIDGIPNILDQLLANALQKQPTDRFTSARTFMQALSNVVPYSQVLDEEQIAVYQRPKQSPTDGSMTQPVSEETSIFSASPILPVPESVDQQTKLIDTTEPVTLLSENADNKQLPSAQPTKKPVKSPLKSVPKEGKTVNLPVSQPVSKPSPSTTNRLTTKRILGFAAAFAFVVLLGLYWLGRTHPPQVLASAPLSLSDSSQLNNPQPTNQPSTTNQVSAPQTQPDATQPVPPSAKPAASNQKPGLEPGQPLTASYPAAGAASATNPANSPQPTTDVAQPNTTQAGTVQAAVPQNQLVASSAKPTNEPTASERPTRTKENPVESPNNVSSNSRSLRLPSGSEVVVELAEPLAAASATDGQRVSLRVVKPLTVNGEIVIERGASVEGEVTDISTSGKKEMLEIQLQTVRTITGKSLKLRSSTFKYVGDRNQPLTFKPGQQFIVYTANTLTL